MKIENSTIGQLCGFLLGILLISTKARPFEVLTIFLISWAIGILVDIKEMNRK